MVAFWLRTFRNQTATMNIIFVVANIILFKGTKLKIFFSTNPDLNPLFKKGYTIDNEYEIYCDETENLFNNANYEIGCKIWFAIR